MTLPKRVHFSLSVSRNGLRLDFDEHFWNNTIIQADGVTQLDYNIAQVVQEIRAALYYVGTEGTKH